MRGDLTGRDGGEDSLGREWRMRKFRKKACGCVHRGRREAPVAGGYVGAVKDTAGKMCWASLVSNARLKGSPLFRGQWRATEGL